VGERGTGKELAAERVHFLSPRWSNDLLKINCGSITETLLESELFGHEAGAFTGATKLHIGRFERADGGTLFLDELGTMSLRLQEKLLRLIEYGEFERVGGNKTLQVSVRVVAATNADLPVMAEEGKFRWDLLDRLSFDVVKLPPLRERPEDIEELANHFAIKFCAELGWELFPGFSSSAMKQMLEHLWPGNIRELKNVVERSIYRWGNQQLPVAAVVLNPFEHANEKTALVVEAPNVTLQQGDEHARIISALPIDLRQWLHTTERGWLERALEACEQNQKLAASKLSLNYDQMRNLVRKHGLHTRPKRAKNKP
jgi:psp operon transcriptional activator